MTLWLVLALMTGAAVFAILWPLARGRRKGVAGTADSASEADLYRLHRADIERDLARGVIGEAEAEAARTELARRTLQRSGSRAAGAETPPSLKHRRLASVLGLLVVPALALPLYLAYGSPQLPDAPLAARRSADPANLDIAQAVARIEAHLAANPNDGQGYEVLAPVYMRLGRYEDAMRALTEAVRLLGDTPKRQADLGEALVAVAGGTVTAEARRAFERAAAADPALAKAKFYLAIAKEQDGDKPAARAAFEDLARQGPPDAPWLPVVRERIRNLGGEPAEPPQAQSTPENAIAALPPAERQAAIVGMVENLAQRLNENGGSLEDWTRLIRAYMVLGERDKARDAAARARTALASDAAAPAAIDGLAREMGLEP